MSFLKKLGSVMLKVTQIAVGIAPVVGGQFPDRGQTVDRVVSDLQVLGGIIAQVEAIGQALNLAGPDKLKAAVPLVADSILRSSLLVNRKIADPVLFNEGATKIADGVVAVLNSLKDDIKTEELKG